MRSAMVTRRARIWTAESEELPLLGRSARQLARSSSRRFERPATATRLTQFLKLTAIEHACKMMRSDLLVRLVDDDGLRPIDIARETGLRPSDLSEMYATAKTFPPSARPAGVPYNVMLLATRMLRKFPALSLDPQVALAEICRQKLSQHRDVSRHFSRLSRTASLAGALPAPPAAANQIVNSLHHRRFQDLLGRIPDGSAKIIHVDPPYVYRNAARGEYGSRSSRSRACDNGTSRAATNLCIDLLRDWKPKLAPGGVLLLWQASGPLQLSILNAVEEHGWHLNGPIIWDKGRPQPGDLSAPYSRQTEMLWVLSRPTDELFNHDGSSRSDIVRFRPVSFPGLADQQSHCFEKPQDLCEFLISKHSRRGELVLDFCGCTGSMSLASITAGRQWIYAESNDENYRVGASRIARQLANRSPKAG